MMDNLNATARVLALPELLRLILETLFHCNGIPSEQRTIRNRSACLMRVNKFWHTIVAELVWKKCGYDCGPYVFDLVRLAQYPDRLEWYTGFIERIFLFNEAANWFIRHRRQVAGRIQNAQLLSNLKLPRLHTLELHYPHSGNGTDSTEAILKPYECVRPSLKNVRIVACGLSAELLHSLQSCSQLEKLDISFPNSEKVGSINDNSISALKTLLGSMQSLSQFHWLDYGGILNYDIFLALAEHAPLRGLNIPVIRATWIEKTLGLVQKPFENLTRLEARIAGPAFGSLAPYTGKIQKLAIEAQDSFPFEALQHLPDLRGLRVAFDLTSCGSINWPGLTLASASCPKLTSIDLDDVEYSTGAGVTDSMIDEVTTLLPGLEVISLCGPEDKHTEVTLKSILCLGRRCKALRTLILEGDNVPVVDLVKYPDFEVLFPSLVTFYLRREEYQPRQGLEGISREDFFEAAKSISRMMPRCERFMSGYWFTLHLSLTFDNEVLRLLGRKFKETKTQK